MATLAIVPAHRVGENRSLGLGDGCKAVIGALGLERAPETLYRGVIETLAAPTHADERLMPI